MVHDYHYLISLVIWFIVLSYNCFRSKIELIIRNQFLSLTFFEKPVMSRDNSPVRSDSSGDSDFKLFHCIDCEHEVLGKNTNICFACNWRLCQNCEIPSGCSHMEKFICKSCFLEHFDNKPAYCPDPSCDCANGSTARKAKERYRAEFKRLPIPPIDKEAWKATHMPINYPGQYTGHYLVDIATSSDEFVRGYIDWLVEGGDKHANLHYTKESRLNFQRYVQEARELQRLLKPSRYNMRQRRVVRYQK